MIVLVCALFGVLWGGFLASKRGGSRLDMAQWAASMGIAFALLGLIVTVFIHRAMV